MFTQLESQNIGIYTVVVKCLGAKLSAKEDIKLLDKDQILTTQKMKESNPEVLNDISIRCISDHLVKDLQ